jgi:hypothetical protein
MALPYKLICLDLDGTLLASRRELDPETIDILRKIEGMGVSLAIVTGRPGFGAKDYAALISESTYFVGSNGAVVGRVDQEEHISVSAMTKETVKKLFEISAELEVLPFLYTDKKICILNTEAARRAMVHSSWHHWKENPHLYVIDSEEQFMAYVMSEEAKITKANLLLPNDAAIKKAIRLLTESERFALEDFSHFGVIEVVEKGMNKSLGIAKLREVLKVDQKDILAFGDGENDREMMLYVGHSVAMGNAIQSIKDIADRIADTNKNKGVARELVKIFSLNNK